MAKTRKLVFWGAGNIGRLCLEQYPGIKPEFFIDSNWQKGCFYNLAVKKPQEIENWDELFVVITTTAIDDIEQILNRKKLIRNQHYARYRDFFGSVRESIQEQIAFIQDFIAKNEYRHAVFIYAPAFTARESDKIIHFFRQYGISCRPQKCILFSDLGIVSREYAQEVMDYPVIHMPGICKWDGSMKKDYSFDTNLLTHADLLTDNEKKWICRLEERKTKENHELSYKVTAEIYWYLKQIFQMLHPSRVMIWGCWSRLSYILEELAKQNQIPCGFMEYGWIPGTFQFDRRGIAGQSEYAVYPEKLLRLRVRSTDTEIKKIRNYIITNKMDTGRFRENEDDEKNILRIDKNKKTVFLVGMDDYGMGINPESGYWNCYVSSVVTSTLEAVAVIDKICRKNDWNFVFKPHPNPANKNQLVEKNLSESVIQVHDMEIDRLLQLADVVVSIVSAVDYKVLIYGKPLVQLGHTTLSEKLCSYEVQDIGNLEYELKKALNKGMTKEQNENFIRHMAQLLENCLWDDLSDRKLRYGLSFETDFFDR